MLQLLGLKYKEASSYNISSISNRLKERMTLTQRLKTIYIIRSTIFEVQFKYACIQIMEIAEKSGINDDDIIIATLQKMINENEIDGEYFQSSKSVVFNQKRINPERMKSAELSKFIADLDKDFEAWEEKEQSRHGKKI